MENPWPYPEPQSRFIEKVKQEVEFIREFSEGLTATDLGTRYVIREEVRSRFVRETKAEEM